MENEMSPRNYGVLDGYFAPYILSAKQSKKAQTYVVSGNNPDVDTASEEDVWNVGGRYSYLTSAEFLTISSSSANDAVGGSGLEYVNLIGLDALFNIQTERVALNGLTGVVTVNQWLRVHVMGGSKPGAADPNIKAAGDIQAVFVANVQAQITVGDTASSMAFFTVPLGYTGFLDQSIMSGGAADDFIISFEVRELNDIFVSRSDFEISNSNVHDFAFDPRVGNVQEKSDIKLAARAVSMNAQVRVVHTMTIIENKYLVSLGLSL